ncbi:hypothetical protein CC80DRAFT_593772 [Byssothecium circinans]|uniref:Rhodopsin domain-containing protein n=1 Tax=Byssothecium circinans TaxID=147558 RepID=A0A6A5TUJ2_9PLEO|nr:hypothetical protein CC80DRAFT_593772 [Byssothecium circinans]
MSRAVDIHTTPAMKAPDGLKSNLVNPVSQHTAVIWTTCICLSLSTLSVMARTFTKAFIKKEMEIEDYSIIFAGLGFGAFSAVMLLAETAGHGRHEWDVSIAGVMRVAYLANILEIVYPPVMFAAKFTILTQIKRIFTTHQKNFVYWSVQTCLAINFLAYFATFIAFIFACWPREKIWNPKVPGKCISTNSSILVTSAINLVSDFMILLIPLHAIKGLHIATSKKIGVGAIFATGIFACISSIIRLYYSVKLTTTHDIMWAIAPVGILAEFATVMLVACIPTFPRLVRYFVNGKEDAHYAYSAEPSSRICPVGSHKAVDGNITPVTMGSYIPLEERKTPLGMGEGFQIVEPERQRTANPAITKRVDIHVSHQNVRPHPG